MGAKVAPCQWQERPGTFGPIVTPNPNPLTLMDPKKTPAVANDTPTPDAPEVSAPTAPLTISRAADTISVIDNETGLEQDVPQAVWKELGDVAQAGYTLKADKPAELR